MTGTFASLFDTSDFPARWHCGTWSSALGWTHIGADLSIFLAYAAIPVAIAHFVRRRRDVSFTPLYWLFAAFIFSCGFGHLLEASIFWYPHYRLAGIVKVITALASWATVLGLVHVLPAALTLPGAARLNEQLRQEIVERKRAEDEVHRLNVALRERVEELQALFDVLPVAIGIATDPDCRHIRPNQAFSELLHLEPTANASLSAPGGEAPTHFRVRIEGREVPPEELPMQVAVRERRPVRMVEQEIRFEDGSEAVVLANAIPLFDRDGAVRGAVGAFMDLTVIRAVEVERQAVDRRVQETQKLQSLGVLAGGVAHDFNNLLTGIMGNTSLMRMELPRTSPLHEYIEPIDAAGARAADLCRQLLAYAGKGRFILQKVDLSEVVRETTWLLQSSTEKDTVLKYQLAESLPTIVADTTQLRQVIMNLVINASEALGGPGTVVIETGVIEANAAYLETTRSAGTTEPGRFVYLEVRDTGSGMTADVVERIFDPFFTTKFTGRGLGLAAVQGIVRGHHGALHVYSEPGRGTVVRVLLPTIAEAADHRGPATPAPQWRGSGKVLVVDDEDMIRKTSARILGLLGFEVLVAPDGAQALEMFSQQPDEIALVLLDLTMPWMDGEETFHALRNVRPNVKVLLMSGFNEQDALQRFIGKGVAGFVQKPFRVDELRDAVRRQLQPS